MLNKIKLKLIKLLLSKKDISIILTSLRITKEECTKKYNTPKNIGYKNKILKENFKNLNKLQKEFMYILDIKH